MAGETCMRQNLTNAELRCAPLDVNVVSGGGGSSGGLTDTQLRATPVPVSGSVTTGGLTDTQLRASAISVTFTNSSLAVTAASLPLPSGAATVGGLERIDRMDYLPEAPR